MKRLVCTIFMLIICITVYFKDGSYTCFKEADGCGTDADIFRQAKIYRIYKGIKIIATIPIENVKYITKECK